MTRAHRTVIALMLLGIAVAVFTSLGRWQLHRADERRALFATIESGRRQPPLDLNPLTPRDALQPWRPVSAQGRWRDDLTVLLDNRNQNGRPGYWIATPLILEEHSETGVLVLRGWLPRAPSRQMPVVLPSLPGDVRTVTGELVERVPRLFELWNPGKPSSDALLTIWSVSAGPPTVQNLDLGVYAKAIGLHLLPTVVVQHAPAGDGLVREWPQPSVDYNQNLGYAMQWFGFASIAGIAFVVVAVRTAQVARATRRGQGP